MRNTTFWSHELNSVKSAAPAQGMPADTDHKQQSKQLQHVLSMPSVQETHCSAALSSNKMKEMRTNMQQCLPTAACMAEREAFATLPYVFGASCSSGCGSLRPYTLSSSALEMRWHTTATGVRTSVNLSMGMTPADNQCSDVSMPW